MALRSGKIQSWTGEVAPSLRHRSDTDWFIGGLETGLNVERTLQGTIKRRAGTKYIGFIDQDATHRWIPYRRTEADSVAVLFWNCPQWIYAVEIDSDILWRWDLNGENKEQVADLGAGDWCGLTISDTHIYAVDDSANTLWRWDLNGENKEQVADLGAGNWQGLTISNTHIYAVEIDSDILWRWDLNGENKEQVIEDLGAGSWNGLTISDTHIYAVDNTTDILWRWDLDGENKEQVADLGAGNWQGLTISDTHIYAVDNSARILWRWDLSGENKKQLVELVGGAWCGFTIQYESCAATFINGEIVAPTYGAIAPQRVLPSKFTAKVLQEMTYAQDGDKMVLAHPDLRPHEILFEDDGRVKSVLPIEIAKQNVRIEFGGSLTAPDSIYDSLLIPTHRAASKVSQKFRDFLDMVKTTTGPNPGLQAYGLGSAWDALKVDDDLEVCGKERAEYWIFAEPDPNGIDCALIIFGDQSFNALDKYRLRVDTRAGAVVDDDAPPIRQRIKFGENDDGELEIIAAEQVNLQGRIDSSGVGDVESQVYLCRCITPPRDPLPDQVRTNPELDGIGPDAVSFPHHRISDRYSIYHGWRVELGWQEVWGDTSYFRADAPLWPGAVAFHEDRLVLAGTRALPKRVWFSEINKHDVFFSGEVQDDQPIEIELSLDETDRIHALFSHNRLAAFTEGSINWIYAAQQETAITPANITSQPVGGLGADSRHLPFFVDGSITFLSTGGKSLVQIFYNNEIQAYERVVLSILTPHFLESGITSLTAVEARDASVGDTIYMTNGKGEIVLIQVYQRQNVVSGLRWQLGGRARAESVLGIGGRLYCLARARLSSPVSPSVITEENLVEVFDESAVIDHTAFFPSGATGRIGSSGEIFILDQMGQSPFIFGGLDGENRVCYILPSLGTNVGVAPAAAAAAAAAANIPSGVRFESHIKSLPLPVSIESRDLAPEIRKRIVKIRAMPLVVFGLTINGEAVGEQTSSREVDDYREEITDPFLDFLVSYGRGYEREVAIEIRSQFPFEIGAIDYTLDSER